jgi:hypothetical protein
MNGIKALKKKMLERGTKLTPSFFHPKSRDKDWAGKVWYVTTLIPHYHGLTEIYVTETDPFQRDIRDHDMILTTKMEKKYDDRTNYLRYFRVVT